ALAVLFACALALAAASLFLIDRAGAGGTASSAAWIRGAIYGVIVICGGARSFLLPARNALGAELVPRAFYPSAVTWRTGIWQVAAVTGPALSGICYNWLGPTASYAIATGLMATALGTVSRIRTPTQSAPAQQKPILASVRTKLAFLMTRQVFVGAMTLDLL